MIAVVSINTSNGMVRRYRRSILGNKQVYVTDIIQFDPWPAESDTDLTGAIERFRTNPSHLYFSGQAR